MITFRSIVIFSGFPSAFLSQLVFYHVILWCAHPDPPLNPTFNFFPSCRFLMFFYGWLTGSYEGTQRSPSPSYNIVRTLSEVKERKLFQIYPTVLVSKLLIGNLSNSFLP